MQLVISKKVAKHKTGNNFFIGLILKKRGYFILFDPEIPPKYLHHKYTKNNIKHPKVYQKYIDRNNMAEIIGDRHAYCYQFVQ